MLIQYKFNDLLYKFSVVPDGLYVTETPNSYTFFLYLYLFCVNSFFFLIIEFCVCLTVTNDRNSFFFYQS